mgnify:CR=1 FL=1
MSGREREDRGPGSRLLRFFLRFLAASIVLYGLYILAGRYYTYLVAWSARPLLALAGHEMDVSLAMKITEEISLNPVVYLSLVIAVTGVGWREKVRPSVIGVLVLTVFNIVTVFLVFLSAITGSETLWSGTEFLNLTINFFLPILLWFLLSPKGDLIPRGGVPRA